MWPDPTQPISWLTQPYPTEATASGNKKLSYRRGAARCVVSVEILPIATQQCMDNLYKSGTNRSYEFEGYSGPMCNKHVHSTMTRSSCFHCLIGVKNKPTTNVLMFMSIWSLRWHFKNKSVFILIVISIPPPHSFIPGLKPYFSANHSHRSLPFFCRTDHMDSPDCLGYPFLPFIFSVLHFLVVGSVR